MSTIKSSTEHLTLNADGSGKDIKFQANGVEKASISSIGAFTSTSIDATKLSGDLPAISGASLTGVGKVLNTWTDTDNTSITTSSTGSWVDLGASVTLTPSSPSSKFHIVATMTADLGSGSDYSSAPDFKMSVKRAISGGATTNEVTNSPNWRMDTRGGSTMHNSDCRTFCATGIDSPGTASAITYTVHFINQSWGGYNGAVGSRYDSTYGGGTNITIMEISS